MFVMEKTKSLNLRYNEMCNDWDGLHECLDPKNYEHGQLVLSWKRLNVSVEQITQKFFDSPKITRQQILYNVSGNVQCGNLLGIMGPSGSGKTTLMATISHRTKGNFKGELLLNGRPVSEEVMIKISGFVPQHDITFEHLTTLEHLYLMANLKMDRRTTKTAIKARVDYMVTALGMREFLDTTLSDLSGGERKKVALAVQLLNDPPILFCDEVTTGLDSYSATYIVNTLKRIARTGKIVICTIHQPASGVFDKFDEVILLSNGRLAYQGPVSMINQLFQKFNYKCPDLYNKADFVISILNSDSEQTKRNVDEMCKLSSTDKQTDLNYDLFNDQILLDYTQHLQLQKPFWITQLILILNRSIICLLRNYKVKLLELGTITFLGVILSTPYMNLKFDTKAVQNWQGFWFSLITNSIFQYCYTSIITYQAEFPVVHREVSNNIYALSVYYISQIVIMFIWTVLETMVYTYLVFWVVGINWELLVVTTFVINMLICRSYGSVLSAIFEKFENIVIFSLVYDYLAVSLCGAYISLRTLPFILYYLKYFSIFFLGCETLSILQWQDIKSLRMLDNNLYQIGTYNFGGVIYWLQGCEYLHSNSIQVYNLSHALACPDVDYCLHDGKEVLLSYGYDINRFNTDIIILGVFYVVSYMLGYYGLLRRTKKQPAY